jgi:hypothetical protein
VKLEPFDIFLPGTPRIVPNEDLDIGLHLDGDLLDRKLASLKEHASQIEALSSVFGDDGFRHFLAYESFVLAATKEA